MQKLSMTINDKIEKFNISIN